MNNSAIERRLYYLLSFLKLKKPMLVLGKKKFTGFRRLDPNASKKGEYNKEFGPVNLPRGTVGSTMMAVGRELLNQYQEEI